MKHGIFKLVLSFIFLFLSASSEARQRNQESEDSVFDMILTGRNEKALKEIKKRVEVLKNGTEEKNSLLMQETSLELKLHDPIAAKASLLQITAEAQETYEYRYKSFLVYGAMLEITPKSHSRFEEYLRQASTDLDRLFLNPTLFNPSFFALTQDFLSKYPNKDLSEKLLGLTKSHKVEVKNEETF